MSNDKKTQENKDKDSEHYHPQFIPSEDNLKKVEKAFDESRKASMKKKFEGWTEV